MYAPDLIAIHSNFRSYIHSDYIMSVAPRILPTARVMSFMDESVLSPVEWLPLYLKVSGQEAPKRTSGPDSTKQYQKSFFLALEDRFVRGSDMVLTQSTARMNAINARNRVF